MGTKSISLNNKEEGQLKRVTEYPDDKKLPPITKELSGSAKFETQKTDKELLLAALEKKYLQEKK